MCHYLRDVGTEEARHVARQEIYGNSVLSTEFCYELKTALKIKSIKNKTVSCARLCAGTVEWHYFSVPLYTLVQLGNEALRYIILFGSQKSHSRFPRDFIDPFLFFFFFVSSSYSFSAFELSFFWVIVPPISSEITPKGEMLFESLLNSILFKSPFSPFTNGYEGSSLILCLHHFW